LVDNVEIVTRTVTQPFHAWRLLLLTASVSLAACGGVPRREVSTSGATPATQQRVYVYVVKRGWHVDVGVAAADLQPQLQPMGTAFQGSRYLLFGFGDRRYLLHGGAGNLLAALWPGPGIVLVTSLRSSQPEDSFGEASVIRLALTPQQIRDLQSFIWYTLATHDDAITPVAPGPYPDSAYYESTQRYSAVYTCNTWVAEVLKSGGLPIDSLGVEFAWQVWHQARSVHNQSMERPTGAGVAMHPP
jgi:Protein of unknown function (DUF2459)